MRFSISLLGTFSPLASFQSGAIPYGKATRTYYDVPLFDFSFLETIFSLLPWSVSNPITGPVNAAVVSRHKKFSEKL